MDLNKCSKRYWSTIPFFFFFLCFSAIAQTVEKPIAKDKNQVTEATNIAIDTLKQNKTQLYYDCNSEYIYSFSKPKIWDMFRYVPSDIYHLGLFAVQKKNLKWDALVLGSTLALIPFDQKILDNAGELGHKMGGWDKDSQYGKLFGVLTIIPKNIPSGVYYMGNGGTTLLIAGLFYGIGKFSHNDARALTTSNELVECLFSVGITTQTLKRLTGRQSPSRAIADGNDGGAWNPAPSFSAFQRNTPNYDAMPSGHIATFMSTITIIATNYPEYKWIKPVGYSAMSLLAFNMVSGKVHWVSDYPIGILIGYVMGKQIANRRINKISKHITTDNAPIVKKKYILNYEFNNFQNTPIIGAVITF